ncbi:MAG TPA: NTP transferase domain-containing protein [Clostridia bacterium]|nr:NTP transferase domain-containing protein [Clostridia bacterium]
MRAVILAAGEGKRLRASFDRPKPLIRLCGLSLIERSILSLRACGIKEFVVITGRYRREIETHLGDGKRLGVAVEYLHNPDWALGNGVSAYTFHRAYRPGERFLLVMADHIFEPKVLQDFLAQEQRLAPDQVLLAADRDLEQVFDLEECTKIKMSGDKPERLGKDLKNFSSVDCGLFMGTGTLLDALGAAIDKGAYALTDAVNALAAAGRLKLHFISGRWIDVDDRDSHLQAEKMLLNALIPSKDGFISKNLNRRFSLPITRQLAKTKVTPNQITFLSLVVAAASALAFGLGRPWAGGLLAQFCSILDGVDGEIARLKFLQNKFGALFDAVLDRYADYMIVFGMVYGWYAQAAHPSALVFGVLALTGIPMSMLFKEKYHALTGSTYIPELHDGVLHYLPANRDGRLFLIMLGGIFNQVPLVLILLALITHLQALARLVKARQLMQHHG